MLYEIPEEINEVLESEFEPNELPKHILAVVSGTQEAAELLIKGVKNREAYDKAIAAEIKELQARKKKNKTMLENEKKFGLLGLVNQLGKSIKTTLGTAYRIPPKDDSFEVDADKVESWSDEIQATPGLITWKPSVSLTVLKTLENPEELEGVTRKKALASIGIRT